MTDPNNDDQADRNVMGNIGRALRRGASVTSISMRNLIQQLSGRHADREEDLYIPDTSVIDKSKLREQMEAESGAFIRPNTPFSRNLSGREIGFFRQKQNMVNPHLFLPSSESPITLARVRDKFFCGIYSQQGNIFMSACQDAKVRISDTTNGQWRRIKTINGINVGWSILDVDFSHDGTNIIYSSWSENIQLCNIYGDRDVHQTLFLEPADRPCRTGIFSLKFTPDDTEIIAGGNNGTMYIFNRERNQRTVMFDAHEDDINCVCVANESGELIYSGGENGLINIWDRRALKRDNPRPVGQLAGHYDSIIHIDSRQDDFHLLSNSRDQSIKVWDIRNIATTEGIEATRRSVSRLDYYVGLPCPERVVKKKLPGDCSVMTYYGHSVARTLIRARFSPRHTTGQRFIYCGDGMGRVIIYNLLTGQVERTLDGGHSREVVRDVSWHPYENNIVSSGWDGKLLRWGNIRPE